MSINFILKGINEWYVSNQLQKSKELSNRNPLYGMILSIYKLQYNVIVKGEKKYLHTYQYEALELVNQFIS